MIRRLTTTLVVVGFVASPATTFAQQARWWKPVVADSAMVVTAKPEATEVGIDVLRRGGNAVDAAIAVHFALAVTLPSAGNIGGGGFFVLREPDGEVRTYDYRERAPLAATEDMYLDESGEMLPGRPSWYGALAAGTPGSVAGMEMIHRRHATLPWEELLAPAIALAERGFEIDPYTRRMIAGKIEPIRRFPDASATLLRDGSLPAIGDTLRQPTLARTLRLIADHGAEVFYRGEIADSIVATMERRGGLITHRDLREYRPRERPAVVFEYRGHRVYSMGPPSSGGITMQLILEQLEPFEMERYPFHGARSVHRITEAMRRAFADRNALLGDPDFVDIPSFLHDPTYARGLTETIDTLAATPSRSIRPELSEAGRPVPAESTETTHFSIVDPEGRAVASTTTLNGSFGSLEMSAGFFLNNEMDDLTTRPGTPNAYGLVQGHSNAIAPGKRPLSAMTPTIVERDGALRYVVGSPGGSTIITTVTQILINTIDYGMSISEALDAGRFHHQHLPDRIFTERWTLSEDTVAALEAMGHSVERRRGYSGRAQGIEVDPETSLRYGHSDPRGGGSAAGF